MRRERREGGGGERGRKGEGKIEKYIYTYVCAYYIYAYMRCVYDICIYIWGRRSRGGQDWGRGKLARTEAAWAGWP